MLKVTGLSKSYASEHGPVEAVKGIDFEIPAGGFFTILGPSGCGKTTTLRCVAGLERPTGGTISIGGRVVADAGQGIHLPAFRRDIGMVFQSYAIWPHMTVFENVAYGLRTRGESKAEIDAKVGRALRQVNLEAFASRYGTELSGGQQQRVALARAIVTSPRLLLFDEPLSNLDARLRERMRFELVALQRNLGQTSLYVTHDQTEAMLMSDRIVLMRDGTIVQVGAPQEIYANPATRFVAEFIGNANILNGALASIVSDSHALVSFGRDHRIEGRFSARATARDAGPMLVCIRPESVQRIAENGDGHNVFSARVEQANYLGADVLCVLQIGTATLRAAFAARSAPRSGETVTVRIDPDDVILITE